MRGKNTVLKPLSSERGLLFLFDLSMYERRKI